MQSPIRATKAVYAPSMTWSAERTQVRGREDDREGEGGGGIRGRVEACIEQTYLYFKFSEFPKA